MAEGAVANSEGDDVRQSIIAVICVGFSVILTSCGGGSSSGMKSVPVVTVLPTPTPTPTPDPEPMPEPMPGPSEGSLLPEIAVTSVLSEDFYINLAGQRIWLETSCDAASCSITILGQTEIIPLDQFGLALANPATEVGEVTMTSGIQSATVRQESDNISLEGYGAWAEYQLGFLGTVDAAFSGIPVSMVVPFVIGTGVDTNPVSGSATWTGTMMGQDYSDPLGSNEAVFGDAQIDVNFADLNLNVLFSNIVGRTTNEAFEDINWPDLMMENGRFSGEGIQGQFFGPNHEEAAGVFNKSDILGAFGTTRE